MHRGSFYAMNGQNLRSNNETFIYKDRICDRECHAMKAIIIELDGFSRLLLIANRYVMHSMRQYQKHAAIQRSKRRFF